MADSGGWEVRVAELLPNLIQRGSTVEVAPNADLRSSKIEIKSGRLIHRCHSAASLFVASPGGSTASETVQGDTIGDHLYTVGWRRKHYKRAVVYLCRTACRLG